MERERFEQFVRDSIRRLPKIFRDKLDNIEIIVEDNPILEKTLLGLYQGVPLRNRGFWYGNVMPDRITLFKNNIERISDNEEDIKTWVNKVLVHEIAHHFGFSEEELKDIGS
jgi:predicted Zn-dependent protease with MMP-like domain